MASSKATQQGGWDYVIRPERRWFDMDLRAIWAYRDLAFMYVKRNFVTLYKQTILGPMWFVVQPVMTIIIYMFIFGGLAGISTSGIPQPLFYMAGILLWNYFTDCFGASSNVFVTNANVFGKVYFPRLAIPVSTVLFSLVTFFTQMILFAVIYVYFVFNEGFAVGANIWILLTPLMILQLALLGLGCGIIVSSVTTKYRDLSILVGFGIQLWMYATPVVYPVSQVGEKYYNLIMLNPVAPVINNFRYAYLGSGEAEVRMWLVSVLFTFLILFIGVILFNRVEKNFMDTV